MWKCLLTSLVGPCLDALLGLAPVLFTLLARAPLDVRRLRQLSERLLLLLAHELVRHRVRLLARLPLRLRRDARPREQPRGARADERRARSAERACVAARCSAERGLCAALQRPRGRLGVWPSRRAARASPRASFDGAAALIPAVGGLGVALLRYAAPRGRPTSAVDAATPSKWLRRVVGAAGARAAAGDTR